MAMISAARTVVAPSQGFTAAGALVASPYLVWPTAEPGDNLDYSLDLTAPLEDVGDVIATVTLTVSPSGTGELSYSRLSVAGDVITWWGAGGVAGRRYLVSVTAATGYGRAFSYVVALNINPTLAAYPLPPPPVPGPGAPISVTSAATRFMIPSNSMYIPIGWG